MRFSIAIAAIFGALSASASLLPRQMPSCAAACATSIPPGPCEATDNACLCRDEAFVSASTQCFMQSCTGAELETALAFAQELCRAVGVTFVSTPPSSTGVPTSAPASASPTAPASGSTTSAAAASASNSATRHTTNTFAGIMALGVAALVL